jgi:hypothetical protein
MLVNGVCVSSCSFLFPFTEEALAPSVLAFDEIVAGPFAAYLKCSKVIGGDVAQHADMAQQGFKYVVESNLFPTSINFDKIRYL